MFTIISPLSRVVSTLAFTRVASLILRLRDSTASGDISFISCLTPLPFLGFRYDTRFLQRVRLILVNRRIRQV